MYKVWDKKNSKFYFCFLCSKNDFKPVLDVFWGLLFFEVGKSCHDPIYTTYYGAIWSIGSAVGLEGVWGSMYKVWEEKNRKFFFVSSVLKMILNVFLSCFEDFCFSMSANNFEIRYIT